MSGFIGLKSSTSLSTSRVWSLREYEFAATLTVPVGAIAAVVMLMGGGGSNAVSNVAGDRPTGGAGGCFVMGTRPVNAGDTLTIIPATGGPAVFTRSDGTVGGTSTVSGFADGSVMTAPGGEGGNLDGTPALGGTIAVPEGDIMFPGGDSGTVTADNACSGGGAPGTPYGPGGRGGNVGTSKCASGGGAPGEGRGGDIPAGAGEESASGGGTLCNAAPDLLANGVIQQGAGGRLPTYGGLSTDSSLQGFAGAFPHILFATHGPGNSGFGDGLQGRSHTSSASSSSTALLFAAAGGVVFRDTASGTSTDNARLFAASGGLVRGATPSSPTVGNPGIGAGPGGAWGLGGVGAKSGGRGLVVIGWIYA